jgi:UDP-glucose 4-epimerase
VLHDFIKKLQENPRELEVLGDGTQTKSYLHIDDCVDAFMMALDDQFWHDPVQVYNIGSENRTNVLDIAKIVIKAMGLKDVAIRTTMEPGGRAWPGDVRTMQLDTSKIRRLGWKAKRSSDQAVRAAAGELLPVALRLGEAE